jgi:hypothetical protein
MVSQGANLNFVRCVAWVLLRLGCGLCQQRVLCVQCLRVCVKSLHTTEFLLLQQRWIRCGHIDGCRRSSSSRSFGFSLQDCCCSIVRPFALSFTRLPRCLLAWSASSTSISEVRLGALALTVIVQQP